MAQQTTIEWLYDALAKNNNSNDDVGIKINRQSQIWKQAKQMDKARIIDAFNKGEIQGLKSTNNSFHSSLITAEEYYNQTYGK